MIPFEPGDLVFNPAAPDWGVGQVQSVVQVKATVNFENMGKLVINSLHVGLVAATQESPFSKSKG